MNPACCPIGEPAASSPRLRRVEDLDQADRVDVPDPGRARQVADPRRVPGQGQDVADAQGVRTEQLGLERHEVAVARRDMDDALEVEVVLDPERHGQRAHPDPGHRRVADVDDIDAGRLEEPGGLDRALDADGARRVDLDRDDVATLLEGAGEAGGRRRPVGRGGDLGADRRDRRGAAPARPSGDRHVPGARIDGAPHRRDVLGRRPAAPADDGGPRVEHVADHPPEVVGAGRVDELALDALGQAGVREDGPPGARPSPRAHPDSPPGRRRS